MSQTESALLALQLHDTHLDQLRYRREHLPEGETLASTQQRLAQLETESLKISTQRDEIVGREKSIERELEAVERRISDLEKHLYQDAGSASRDLQAMTAEVDHLRERKSEFEDSALVILDELSPVDAELGRVAGEITVAKSELSGAESSYAKAAAEVDSEIAVSLGLRSELEAAVDSDALATYDALRAKLGGVAVARFDGKACHGCDLNRTFAEGEAVTVREAPATGLVRCEECTRILARVAP